MVVTMDADIPEPEELEVDELNISTAHMMAAAPWLGKFCENVNAEFMLCRIEKNSPLPCVDLGKEVTKCAMEFFQKVKRKCLHEHMQFTNCVDKSSGNYAPWPCRETMKAYDYCLCKKLCVEYPGFAYHTRARIHTTKMDKPEQKCLCRPGPDEETRALPDCRPRIPARFGGRWFWFLE